MKPFPEGDKFIIIDAVGGKLGTFDTIEEATHDIDARLAADNLKHHLNNLVEAGKLPLTEAWQMKQLDRYRQLHIWETAKAGRTVINSDQLLEYINSTKV